jgi:hypothetical protein
MSLTVFREVTEITVTRFADSPLGKLTEGKSFDKPISDYDEPLGIICEDDYDIIAKKQEESIDKAKNSGVENLSTAEKGNFGEMCTDKDLRDKGYVRISKDIVTDVSESGRKGIDGVYENPNGNPRFLIVDSKYGSSQLQETQDGKQLSEDWINKRLDDSVGKEKADEIRLERVFNPDNVGVVIAHVDKNGNVTYEAVDSTVRQLKERRYSNHD